MFTEVKIRRRHVSIQSNGARQWLINQAGTNRLLHVFDQGEFSRFASRGRL